MEQALVLASIVLGVAIAFELEHLNTVLRAKNVKWHWAQPLFALFVLLVIVSFWWMAASNAQNNPGPLSFGAFMPIMFMLVVLALLAGVSFPNEVPEEGIDLAQYYQEARRYQWGLMSLYFWALNIGFLYRTAQETSTMGEFFGLVATDTIAAFLVTSMMFVKTWWKVAVGFAILSISPAIWLPRIMS